MFETMAIVVIALISVVLVYAASKPDTFHIERSTSIKALPEKIFAIIDNHHHWEAWSPWEKLDPAMKRTFSGPASGKGAIFEWDGNRKAGAGRSEITESSPPSRLVMRLDMFKPFKAQNTVEFNLEPQGDATRITWAMRGPQPYVAKVMGTLMDCDKMVGKNFEEGLASLKALAEK